MSGQLQDWIRRRDTLQVERQRLEVMLEQATRNIESLEQELKSKGISPDQIDDVLAKLQARHESLFNQFTSQILEAEKALKSVGGVHVI